jgi:hypothetical protein
MAKSVFNLASLHKIDQLRSDFDAQLKAAVADCKARPRMEKPREIKIVLRITPSPADPADVVVHSHVDTKTPSRVVLPYLMQTTVNDGLKFATDSPMQPDQDGLFDEQE